MTNLVLMVSGNFVSGEEVNLVIAKNNHLELSAVTPEGLRPVKNFTINGAVDTMMFFRPPVSQSVFSQGLLSFE